MAKTPGGMLKAVSELKPEERSPSLYDDWAGDYDKELLEDYGYVAPQISVEAFVTVCPDKDCRVMDFGCGTGLVGQGLAQAGYRNVEGLDLSRPMLDQARAKNVYRALRQADLTKPLDIASGSFDAAICVGSFGNGHLGPEHLAEMIRTVAPGGPIVLYINGGPYSERGYPAQFERLEAEGLWRVERTEESNYMAELERPGWLVVARRTRP